MAANLFYSTELLTQYIQSEVVAPDKKFEAIQSPNGHSLLFSISTEGAFCLIEEMPSLATGWQKNDLSSGLKGRFPTDAKVVAKTFATGQNTANATFSVSLVLTVTTTITVSNTTTESKTDYLFVASSYTRDAAGYITLNWVAAPFDAVGKSGTNLDISAVYTLQTSTCPLIVVDTVPSGKTTIERYYIDSTKKLGRTFWYAYTFPVNMTEDTIRICVGRKTGEDYVDGIYSVGEVGNEYCIFYQQLYNPFASDAPKTAGATSQLITPEGATPVAIAPIPSVTVPNLVISPTNVITYTDLFTTTREGDLYLFPANKQVNNKPDQAVLIMNNALFKGIASLFAFNTGQKVVVWGLNDQQQVFYTQCPIETVSGKKQLTNEWTYPLVIGTEIEQISPYANRVNGGNTYFAHVGKDTLEKVFQDPFTTCWQVQNIQLPVIKPDPLPEFNAYTTKFTVKDEAGATVPNAQLAICSTARMPTYINNHYYVLDVNPITIPANGGTLTVIQPVTEDLQSAALNVQVLLDTNYAFNSAITYDAVTNEPSAPLKPVNLVAVNGFRLINPMDKATNKMLALNDADTLAAAEYTEDDGTGATKLVESTDTAALNSTAGSLTQLTTVNSSITTIDPKMVAKMTPKMRRACIAHKLFVSHEGGVAKFKILKKIKSKTVTAKKGTPQYKEGDPPPPPQETPVAAGDLFRKLKSVRANWIEIRENTREKVWEFVCEFADGIVTFVIDTVEKVVGAIQAVLEAVGTLLRGLAQFVKLLFAWDDIAVTARVHAKIVKVVMNNAIYSLDGSEMKALVKSVIGNVQAAISEWADVPLEPASTMPSPNTATTTTNANAPTEDTSGSDSYLQDQLANNVEGAELNDDSASSLTVSGDDAGILYDLFDSFKTLIEDSTDDIKDAFNLFYDTLLCDWAFLKMPILDVFKKTVVILSDLILDLAENVLNLVIDILVYMIEGIWNLLNKGIWIPILSPILQKFFKIELPSAIDLLMYVTAMPATMGCMVNRNLQQAPYSVKGVPNADAEAILALNVAPDNKPQATIAYEQLKKIFNGTPKATAVATARATTAPTAAKKSAEQPTYKLDNPLVKEGFYVASRFMTACNDAIAAILIVPMNVPGVKRLGTLKALFFANNLMKVTIDKAVALLADPQPPILADPKYAAVLRTDQVFTRLHIAEKAVFYAYIIADRGINFDFGGKRTAKPPIPIRALEIMDAVADGFINFCLSVKPLTVVSQVGMKGADANDGLNGLDPIDWLGISDSSISFCRIATSFFNVPLAILGEKNPYLIFLQSLMVGFSTGSSLTAAGLRVGEGIIETTAMFKE